MKTALVHALLSPPPEGFTGEDAIGKIKRDQLVDVVEIIGARARVRAPEGKWRNSQPTGWASIQSRKARQLLVPEIVSEDPTPFPDWRDGPAAGSAVEGWLEYNYNKAGWKLGYFSVQSEMTAGLMKQTTTGTFRATATAEGNDRSGILTQHASREVSLLQLLCTRFHLTWGVSPQDGRRTNPVCKPVNAWALAGMNVRDSIGCILDPGVLEALESEKKKGEARWLRELNTMREQATKEVPAGQVPYHQLEARLSAIGKWQPSEREEKKGQLRRRLKWDDEEGNVHICRLFTALSSSSVNVCLIVRRVSDDRGAFEVMTKCGTDHRGRLRLRCADPSVSKAWIRSIRQWQFHRKWNNVHPLDIRISLLTRRWDRSCLWKRKEQMDV